MPLPLARLKDGRVKKIGMEGNFDTEIIIASQPDIIFVSPNRRGGYEVIKELNIPLVPYWAFKETSPLGLSEWIKVAGMFIGQAIPYSASGGWYLSLPLCHKRSDR